VVTELVEIVSKNGNLLLNIPVRGDGTIDDQEVKFLEGMTQWMDINGEGIFSTRPFTIYGEANVRSPPRAIPSMRSPSVGRTST